ncbi:hypothetical protein AMK10_18305 [Streptomyces sp. CB02058]|nr:hypothetical protein AMK10_18305 [Streptomyces sp. CB02058]
MSRSLPSFFRSATVSSQSARPSRTSFRTWNRTTSKWSVPLRPSSRYRTVDLHVTARLPSGNQVDDGRAGG